MLSRTSSRSQPLPEKISLLLQEARWLILGVMSLYVGLILLGYSKADPGWSHASDVARVANPGGRFGAWMADLLLYLFGISSWWWVVFLGYSLLWGFRRIKNRLTLDHRSFVFVMLGFLFVLLTSSALEFLRFHSHGAAVPLAPGLRWDTSRLALDGSVAVVAVPEPGTWALWSAGLAGLLLARRSRRPIQGPGCPR